MSEETDLPEPDSPTMPSVLPALDAVGDAVDGLDQAVLGLEVDPEVLDLKQRSGHQYRTRGSMNAYRMSTMSDMLTMKKAPNSTVPWITGRSDCMIAL